MSVCVSGARVYAGALEYSIRHISDELGELGEVNGHTMLSEYKRSPSYMAVTGRKKLNYVMNYTKEAYINATREISILLVLVLVLPLWQEQVMMNNSHKTHL